MRLIPLAVALIASMVIVYVAVRLSRWRAGVCDPIGTLIKPPKPCEGMERIDWSKAERAGERVWCETLRAQRRTRRPAQVTESGNVVAIGIKRRNG